ncbi:MAG TPA: gliding motility-associated C-terminal domain-containing protein, partial [Bacteroidales bacterium]|nr:gliding motility-associated C-terminal domain-containing protein [Bacteroidales bacterium]
SKSGKEDALRDAPTDQESEPTLTAKTPPEDDTSAVISPRDAFRASPDLKSGEDKASSDLQSPSPPCEIKAEYNKEPSCNNKATGVIRIVESTLAGGTPPYQVILNGEHGDSLVFRGLKPGFYKLEIKDASDCLVSLGTIIVDIKECRYEGNFYPLLEVWEMPLDSRPGTIEIVNKNGVTVYRLRFDGTGREYWNGNDMNNEALPMGIYFFTIRYDSGDVFQGSVTINR